MTTESSKGQRDRDRKYSTLLWYRIVRIHKNNTKGTSDLLKEWNLSKGQVDILIRLTETRQLSQQELADKLLVTKGNITQLLNKLEQLKLIKREKDWKTNYISLTDEGKELCNQIIPALEEHQTDFFQKLSIEEKKQLLTLLRKIEK